MAEPRPDRELRPGDPAYPEYAQEQCTDAYRAPTGHAPDGTVTCPACGHVFDPAAPVRVTESAPVVEEAEAAKVPYGDVEYADSGLQKDGKKRYPIDTKARAKAAWSYVNKDENAAKYTKTNLSKIKARIKAALKKFGVAVSEATSEAMIDGKRSYADAADAVRDALRVRARAAAGGGRRVGLPGQRLAAGRSRRRGPAAVPARP